MIFYLDAMAFSGTCRPFLLSSFAWMAITSTICIMSKYGTHSMVLAKLRPLFSSDPSETLNYRMLILKTNLIQTWSALSLSLLPVYEFRET